MAKKRKLDKLITPVGVAEYPWLNKPDTKFNPQGVFRVTLILDPEDHTDFLADLDRRADEAFENAKKAVAKKKPQDVDKITRKEPFEPEYDSEGVKTGLVKLKFKMNHIINTKNGEMVLTPDLFDAQGKPVDLDSVSIYGGSKLRINFSPNPYYMASTKLAGVSLRLNAVQIIELVSSAGGNADAYGFGTVEDGFDASSVDNSGDFEEEEETGGDFDISEEDF